MAGKFYVDSHSATVIRDTVETVKELSRPMSPSGRRPPLFPLQPNRSPFLGFAKITAAGADATHWKWEFALRAAADGTFTAGKYGSDEMGECVIANAGYGGVGIIGEVFYQLGDDGAAALILVPINVGFLIPVTITFDSGTNGDATTAPAYTYKNPTNVITGAEILKADGTHATGLSPAWARSVGEFNTATHGVIYINSSGDPVLWQCDETEMVCT